MKSIVFSRVGGPDVLELSEVTRPEPKAGQVLIKVAAAGINFADTLFRQGQYAVAPKLPDTPGFEASGIIEDIGAGVSGLRPGMRVAAMGGKTYAEYCLAPAAQTIPLPDSVTLDEGAAFPIQVLTAWHMLHTSHQIGPKQTVLIHSAAGGVGLVAIQIAKAAGAYVIGTASTESKLKLAKEYGADDLINYVERDFAAEVTRLTNGRGVDLILDAVGKPTLAKGLSCLAPFGHLILFGRSGGAPEPVDLFSLFAKSVKVSGFMLFAPAMVPGKMQEGIEKSFQLMREGKLKLLIGRKFPLAEAAEAHRFMESRESVGKLLLVP